MLAFGGCQKDELNYQSTKNFSQEMVNIDVYTKNGILVFPSHEQLSETLKRLSLMGEQERRFWENKHSFVSQMSMFHDIVFAELKLDVPYENMSEEEFAQAVPPAKHSETYYKYLDKGFIKEFIDVDNTETYDYNTSAPYLVSILNDDGVFAVADTMYQYTVNSYKEWIGCNSYGSILYINHYDQSGNQGEIYDVKLKNYYWEVRGHENVISTISN